MKAIILTIICLFLLSSCKKDAPDLPLEYEYIKGEWVAYETTVYTSDLHGGFIPHTKPVENLDFRLYIYDDKYILERENIEKIYNIRNVYVEPNYDTNIVEFAGSNFRLIYFKNEDIIDYGGEITLLFPEISAEANEGGNTYYRRVQ